MRWFLIRACAGMTALFFAATSGQSTRADDKTLTRALMAFGVTLQAGLSLKDLEVARVEITARAQAGPAPPAAVTDELAAIGTVQDLWDVIIHGWTCRNFDQHEVVCIASLTNLTAALGLKLDDRSTPETILRDALAVVATKNERSLAALGAMEK